MSGFLSALGLNPYDAVIGPSSWRGINFIVTDISNTLGRNTATHIFPYATFPIVEDIGRAPEYMDVRGFLSSPMQQVPQMLYGSTATEGQFRDALKTLYGPGIFVHPSLGKARMACINASMSYSKDRLGIINLSLRLVLLDPKGAVANAPTPNTVFSLQSAVSSAISSVTQGFTSAAVGFLSSGVGLAVGAVLTCAAYVATAVSICTDAASVSGEVKGLSFITDDTVTLGRYANGNLTLAPPPLQSVNTTQPMPAIIQDGTTALRAAQVVAVTTVQQASAALLAAAQRLTINTVPSFTAAAVAALQALSAASNDPADQLRLLCAVASNSTISPVPGAALAANLLSWLACAVLAETISNYQPTSSTDADNVLVAITPIFQAAITQAGDAPDIVSFQALQALFAGVWTDLTTRGSQLPPLITWNVPAMMPAATLAQFCYQTGQRTNELIQRINPIAPLFCPAQFTALSY